MLWTSARVSYLAQTPLSGATSLLCTYQYVKYYTFVTYFAIVVGWFCT